MKIGILTGGGDCPGLNAVIRAVVKKAEREGDTVLGIRNGWKGLIRANVEPLTGFSVGGILPKGGTILGTSRTNPFKSQEDVQKCKANFKKFGVDALIVIGGEDTLGVARQFFDDGLPVVGVPKTIDNDLPGTDQTFGFDTACNIVMEAIDRLHSTAESHHRVIVVEVMGRDSGWIAAVAGMAGGADFIIIPEEKFDLGKVVEALENRKKRDKDFSIVVVAEGVGKGGVHEKVAQDTSVDQFGHVKLGGIGAHIARELEEKTGIEARVTILGHIQRGGSPTAFDRVLATRYGLRAYDFIKEGKFGHMAALDGSKIVARELPKDPGKTRRLDMELYRDAEVFFG
ncbi:MAG: 6-phosphofructokinase [Planctomycetota bacterium]|jgi:6-phosphofructokinase 1